MTSNDTIYYKKVNKYFSNPVLNIFFAIQPAICLNYPYSKIKVMKFRNKHGLTITLIFLVFSFWTESIRSVFKHTVVPVLVRNVLFCASADPLEAVRLLPAVWSLPPLVRAARLRAEQRSCRYNPIHQGVGVLWHVWIGCPW